VAQLVGVVAAGTVERQRDQCTHSTGDSPWGCSGGSCVLVLSVLFHCCPRDRLMLIMLIVQAVCIRVPPLYS